jgi:hypothetical protein
MYLKCQQQICKAADSGVHEEEVIENQAVYVWLMTECY